MPRVCIFVSATHSTSCAWPAVVPEAPGRASHACLRLLPSQAYHGNCTPRVSNHRCPSSNGRETRCVRSAAPNTPRPRGGAPPSAPTIADIEAAAAARGVRLEIETTGPFFTISAYDATGAFDDRRDGVREGQGGARTSAGRDARGGKPRVRMARIDDARQRGVFGAALLIGALVFRWALDTHGCRVAQLLAIDDTDEYHAKLVKYYSRLGMRAVRVVEGGSLGDVPHMLVWGGAGTLMEGEILPLLTRWARVFPPAAAAAAAAAAAPAATIAAATGSDVSYD
ncbi:unnamed protein product [Closterium sp. Yama58-4]|nr:unnamed protein product [Closterium sp. Yama58-4]